MRWFILFNIIFSMVVLSLLAHEMVHMVQLHSIKDKQICLFSKGHLAYIDTDVMLYEQNSKDEIVANIFALMVMLAYVWYVIKNQDYIVGG